MIGQEKMKMFDGNRPLDEIRKAVEENGWPWNQDKYDQGGDWITFGFVHGDERFEVLLNSFNGKFLVKIDDGLGKDHGRIVTERDDDMDDVPWYAALMDFIYIPSGEIKEQNNG